MTAAIRLSSRVRLTEATAGLSGDAGRPWPAGPAAGSSLDPLHAHFAAHGWAVVRGVVSAGRLAELEAAVDALSGTRRRIGGGAVWEVPAASRAAPAIACHTYDPRVAEYVARALGSEGVRLLQDTVLVTSPGTRSRVAWHRDHTYLGYLRPPRVASARLALTPCTLACGCLQVIDGSHLDPPGEVRALSESRIIDALGAAAAALRARAVAVELQPGDLSIHHCLTLHGSAENRSDRARKTLITRFFDVGCTLDRGLLPAAAAVHFPTDDAGRLDARTFPLLWPR